MGVQTEKRALLRLSKKASIFEKLRKDSDLNFYKKEPYNENESKGVEEENESKGVQEENEPYNIGNLKEIKLYLLNSLSELYIHNNNKISSSSISTTPYQYVTSSSSTIPYVTSNSGFKNNYTKKQKSKNISKKNKEKSDIESKREELKKIKEELDKIRIFLENCVFPKYMNPYFFRLRNSEEINRNSFRKLDKTEERIFYELDKKFDKKINQINQINKNGKNFQFNNTYVEFLSEKQRVRVLLVTLETYVLEYIKAIILELMNLLKPLENNKTTRISLNNNPNVNTKKNLNFYPNNNIMY